MYAKLFKDLLSGEVDFLLLGGSAVCLHGYPRMTTDIDVLLKNTQQNIDRFVSVVSKWGEGCASGLVYDDFQGPGAVRIIEEFPLDVFTLVDGRPYENYVGNAVKYSIADGIDVPCFSISDLIEVKRKTLREKDQLDVSILRRLQAQSEQPDEPRTILLDASLLAADEAAGKQTHGESDPPKI